MKNSQYPKLSCLVCFALVWTGGIIPLHAELITPKVHAFSSEHASSQRFAKNTVNGSLLLDGKHILSKQRGGTDVAGTEPGSWMTIGIGGQKDLSPYIIYDLGSVTDVKFMQIWNFNDEQVVSLTPEDQKKAEMSTWHRRLSVIGADKVEVSTSADGKKYESRGIVRFEQATSRDDYTGQKIQVDYRQTRYIRFDIKSSHEGALFDGTENKIGPYHRYGMTGLSEVRFGGASIVEIQFEKQAQELSLAEGGQSSAYRVRLRKKPNMGEPVTVRAIAEDPILELNGKSKTEFLDLKFSPGNWDQWQPVKVKAVDDKIATVRYKGKIKHLVATGENPEFSNISARDVFVKIKDNDQEVVEQLDPIDPEQRMDWFNDIKYSWMICWNPSSLTGNEISFARDWGTPPAEEYDQLYKKFKGEKFNAEEWVKIAKVGGLKTIVFITKHCDGFCMWDTKTTDYNIMKTPFGRDVTKELAEACKKHGLRFSLYYSVMDWWHPDYMGLNMGNPGAQWPKQDKPNFKRFVKYMDVQVNELLKNYGDVSLMWWDGGYGLPGSGTYPHKNSDWEEKDREAFDRRAKELQPAMVQNNRVDLNFQYLGKIGDYTSTEFGLGGYNWGGKWEYTFTLGTQWSWKPDDLYKSKRYMIQLLLSVAARGGHALMDVSPGPTGAFEPQVVKRLTGIGNWLKLYGESYYGTRGGPYIVPNGSWGVATRKGNKVYLHVFNWPSDGKLTLTALGKKVIKSSVLTGGKVKIGQDNASSPITIEVPAHYQKEIDTIVVLELDGDAMKIAPIHTK